MNVCLSLGEPKRRQCYVGQITIRATLHFIVETEEVEHYCVGRISSQQSITLVWRGFHHWESLDNYLRERRSLQREWRKELPCWGFLSTISQRIISNCLVLIYCIHLLLSTVNKGSAFPLYYWPVFFIKHYLCAFFLSFYLNLLCIHCSHHLQCFFSYVFPLTQTKLLCDFFAGNN